MAEFTTADGVHVVTSDPMPDPEPVQTETPAAPEPDQPAPPAESAPAPQEPDEEPVPRGVQRRIDQLVARSHATERELSEAKARVEVLTRMVEPQRPQPPAEPQGPPRRPREEHYATREAFEEAEDQYIEAALDYRLQEREQRQTAQARAQQQDASEAEVIQASRAREAEVVKAYPDYYDRVDRLIPTLAPSTLWGLQRAGEDGPDLALYLVDNPDDVQRLNRVPAHLIGHELGRLARRAVPERPTATSNGPAAPAAAESRPPRLPEPPQPVGGSGATVTPGYRDDMTQEQFDAWAARTYPKMAYTHRR